MSASSATDPAVWYGPDFRGNDEWIFALDPRHVSELEAVVDSVPASGDALVDLQRSNCEMPPGRQNCATFKRMWSEDGGLP